MGVRMRMWGCGFKVEPLWSRTFGHDGWIGVADLSNVCVRGPGTSTRARRARGGRAAASWGQPRQGEGETLINERTVRRRMWGVDRVEAVMGQV